VFADFHGRMRKISAVATVRLAARRHGRTDAVSALIHAATMVTAGVYVVARSHVLFAHAPTAMLVVAIVGCATAFFAATIGFGADGYQEGSGVFHGQPVGLHVSRMWRWRVLRWHFSFDDACLFQSTSLPRGGQRDFTPWAASRT